MKIKQALLIISTSALLSTNTNAGFLDGLVNDVLNDVANELNKNTTQQQPSNDAPQLPLYEPQLRQYKHCLNNPNDRVDYLTCGEWVHKYERDKSNNQLQKSMTWIEIPDEVEVDQYFNVEGFMGTFEDDMLEKCQGGNKYAGIEYDLTYTCRDRRNLLSDIKGELRGEVRREQEKAREAFREKKENDKRKKLADKKKKEQLEKERVEKQAKLDSSSVVLTPNGKVAGYKDLKFGITRSMAKSILEKNCTGDVKDSGKKITGSQCFNVFNSKVAEVSVGFNDKKLAVVTLDFNGNITNPIMAMIGGIYTSFNKGTIKSIKKNLRSKYKLTESNNDFNGYQILSYEHGAIILTSKYEWNTEAGRWVTSIGLDYLTAESAKVTLKALRLGKGNQEEF